MPERHSPAEPIGHIGRTHDESTPWWPAPPHPGEDAPDIVVILLDDTGFAHLGCYGSELHTPNIDRLAAGGLRYTNFHVTPLCSPTRAALLTGRNHHTVGMRAISNLDSGYPHMRGHISNSAATVAEVLRDEGYATFGVGKWHLCPMEQASAAGPFDQWPCQRGFDRFYGFLEGETDQFHPELIYDNHAVDPPGRPEDGYHLSEDLVDRALGFLHDSVSIRPDRPCLTYLSFGAMHAPHQAPPEYLEKYRGRFDEGWDVARRAMVRPTGGDGAAPRRHRAGAAQPGGRGVGLDAGRRSAPGCPPAGGVRRVPGPHRRADRTVPGRPGTAGPAGQHHRSWCCPTTAPARRAARSGSCTR